MYNNIEEVTLESLKRNSTLIHYFGLGFIQIKLGEKYRMHFYDKDLPAIVHEEEIHNHRYDFKSRVLAGEFWQAFYVQKTLNHANRSSAMIVEEESCKADVKSDAKPYLSLFEEISSQTFSAGSEYSISHSLFHKVKADFAITILERGEIVKENAEVARRQDAEKICPFSKQISEEELWEKIDQLLIRAKSK